MLAWKFLFEHRLILVSTTIFAFFLVACTEQPSEKNVSVMILTPKSPIPASETFLSNDTPQLNSEIKNTGCQCIDQAATLPDGTIVAPLSCKLGPSCEIAKMFNPPTYLHIKQHTNCYSMYDEYYIEAKTTIGENENGVGIPTENLSIAWRVNTKGGNKGCGRNSFCAYSDRIYGYCVTQLCSKAQAIINGQKLTVGLEEDCKV